MRRHAWRMLRHGWLLAVVAALLVPAVAGAQTTKNKPAPAAQKKHQKSKDNGDEGEGNRQDVAGAFYTTTNGNPNQLLWFVRHHDGTLTQRGSVATGGNGGHQPQPINVPGLPAPVCEGGMSGCPSLDSQGALRGTPDGKLLFTVNAGSNTVSSFRVTDKGPVLVSQVSSGGAFPNSLTVRGNLLYVLNSNSLSVQGMTFNSSGTLTLLGGPHALNPSGTAPGSPKDIEFDNTGHWLLVTKLVNPMAFSPVNTIDNFPVHLDGTVGAPVSSNSAAPVPFSMGFDAGDNVLVSTVGDPFAFKPGTVESYSIGPTGALTHIASVSSGGYAPCWNEETKDRGYGYVVNADVAGPSAPSVSTYKLSGNGQMQLLGTTPHLGAEPFQTDEALSRDDKYLYVISPVDDRAYDPISHVDVFKIGEDHTPRLIQQTPFNLANGLTGAVAY